MNFKNLFKYTPPTNYNFTLQPTNSVQAPSPKTDTKIYMNIDENLKYIQCAYNTLINSDIILREFELTIKTIKYKAFILYIDGMVDSDLVNRFILSPLMLKNENILSDQNNKHSNLPNFKTPSKCKSTDNFNLENYIYSNLIPQNSIEKQTEFSKIIEGVNSGNCCLFIDTISSAFDIDVKGFKQRSVESPNNEIIIKGPQEAFVENIRTNTSLLRRIINNENLIIENTSVAKISKTKVAVCYMKNIANSDLVAEVKYRINNLSLDAITSTGELEQLIEDNSIPGIPQLVSTERPDKCAKHLMQGRVVILVNGNPYALIAPAVLADFLSSPEDTNLKVVFANFLKMLRFLAYFITLLLPGMFIAVTSFHQELLPTELLFSMLGGRANVPFPIIFELLIMEISFELIREGGLRIPSPIGSTLGIVGALIIGDAAVTANIVSPILIIIVAITGLSSFAIPDYSFSFHLRVYRFIFTLLGYIAGFLGIALGLFVYINLLCELKSFGISYVSPIAPMSSFGPNAFFVKPTFKQEKRASFVAPIKTDAQPKISKKWDKQF